MWFGLKGVVDGDTYIRTPKQLIKAEVADQESTRNAGLSGRNSLGRNSAMLFVFPQDAKHGIWMKDMNFPIDIVWLDSSKLVVYIADNVQPDSYPTIFAPDNDARYVIELPAGRAAELEIKPGTVLSW